MQGHYLFGIAKALKPLLKQMKKFPVDQDSKIISRKFQWRFFFKKYK